MRVILPTYKKHIETQFKNNTTDLQGRVKQNGETSIIFQDLPGMLLPAASSDPWASNNHVVLQTVFRGITSIPRQKTTRLLVFQKTCLLVSDVCPRGLKQGSSGISSSHRWRTIKKNKTTSKQLTIIHLFFLERSQLPKIHTGGGIWVPPLTSLGLPSFPQGDRAATAHVQEIEGIPWLLRPRR